MRPPQFLVVDVANVREAQWASAVRSSWFSKRQDTRRVWVVVLVVEKKSRHRFHQDNILDIEEVVAHVAPRLEYVEQNYRD